MVSWKQFLAGLDQLGKNPAIALIGAGAAGCELALAINFKLKNLGYNPLITLVDVGKVASSLPNKARKKILGCLKQNDIQVKEHTKIPHTLSHFCSSSIVAWCELRVEKIK